MQKCVVYARYSPGGNQTFQSIEGQLRVCRQYAKDNDLKIVATYADEHMTGKNDNRPEFRKMIKDSAKGNWEFVLVYSIDRFARNRIEASLNKYTLQKSGIVLLSATQKTSENADGTKNLDGILLESLYEGMAEYYSEELSQKVRRGQNESVSKGNFLGGAKPYGYDIVNKKYVINEAQAEVVRRMFSEYRDGKTVDAIIDGLTKDCIFNNFGRKFSKTAIMNIFINERYIGNLVFGSLRHDNCIPPIVPKEDFDIAQKRMEYNKKTPGRGKAINPYLLTGKLFCGHCGAKMLGESGTSKTGDKYYYYKCYNQKRKRNRCKKSVVSKDKLETFIAQKVINLLFNKEGLAELAHNVYIYNEELINSTEQLDELQTKYKETEKAIDNIIKAIEQGIFSDATKGRLNTLEATKANLDEQILAEEQKRKFALKESDILEYFTLFASGDIENNVYKAKLIDTFVNKVYLWDDHCKIVFNHTDPYNNHKAEITLEDVESAGLSCSYIEQNTPPNSRYPNFYLTKGYITGVFELPEGLKRKGS